MASDRKAQTMQLSGNAYAKVAERLKLFREDNPRAKTESAYETDVDGTIVFTVWLWREKADLLELMKSGVVDKEVLRSSADANGTAKSSTPLAKDATTATRVAKTKEFEKLESVALGRALAMLGYLASGEIASSEEMEEFENFRAQQRNDAIQAAIETLNAAKTMDELKKAFIATRMMAIPEVIEAKDKRKAELSQPEIKPVGKQDSAKVGTNPEKTNHLVPEQPNAAN